MEEALDLYLDACVEASKPLRPLRDLAPLIDTTVEYLSLLARTGKIDAKKQGQIWHSTQEAIAQYFQEALEQPRGRSLSSHPVYPTTSVPPDDTLW